MPAIETMSGGGENSETEKSELENGEQSTLPPTLNPPTELITRIFAQLDCIDLVSCSLVCKQWYVDSAELREGWKNEYLETYIRLGLGIRRESHPPSTTCSIRVSVVMTFLSKVPGW